MSDFVKRMTIFNDLELNKYTTSEEFEQRMNHLITYRYKKMSHVYCIENVFIEDKVFNLTFRFQDESGQKVLRKIELAPHGCKNLTDEQFFEMNKQWLASKLGTPHSTGVGSVIYKYVDITIHAYFLGYSQDKDNSPILGFNITFG